MRRTRDIVVAVESGVEMHLVDFACDSTEVSSLPTTGIVDGSTAITTNTAEVYFFNEESSAWTKV